MKNITFVLIILLMGCSQFSNELHPWQSSGNAFNLNLDVSKWETINKKYIGFIDEKHLPEIIQELQKKDYIQISIEKAKEICPNRIFKDTKDRKAYIIRGVSYSKSPSVGILRINPELNWVYFYQATYNGEMYIPGRKYTPHARPIVVLLKQKPTKVFAVANVGGDGIFRGPNSTKTWW